MKQPGPLLLNTVWATTVGCMGQSLILRSWQSLILDQCHTITEQTLVPQLPHFGAGEKGAAPKEHYGSFD